MIAEYMDAESIVDAVAQYLIDDVNNKIMSVVDDVWAYLGENTNDYKYTDDYIDTLNEELEYRGYKHGFKTYDDFKNFANNLESGPEQEEYWGVENDVNGGISLQIVNDNDDYEYIVPCMYAGDGWENSLVGILPDTLSDYDVFKAFLRLGRGEQAFEENMFNYFVDKYFN